MLPIKVNSHAEPKHLTNNTYNIGHMLINALAETDADWAAYQAQVSADTESPLIPCSHVHIQLESNSMLAQFLHRLCSFVGFWPTSIFPLTNSLRGEVVQHRSKGQGAGIDQ